MSDEHGDACVESCLQKMAVKGLCEHFPAFSPKMTLFEVLDNKTVQCLSQE